MTKNSRQRQRRRQRENRKIKQEEERIEARNMYGYPDRTPAAAVDHIIKTQKAVSE